MLQVVPFEMTIVGLTKVDQHRHDFTRTQGIDTPALAFTGGELVALPLVQKLLKRLTNEATSSL